MLLVDIGDEGRLERVVMGETVNIARRPVGMTRRSAVPLIVSDQLIRTARGVRGAGGARLDERAALGPKAIRGVAAPVTVWCDAGA